MSTSTSRSKKPGARCNLPDRLCPRILASALRQCNGVGSEVRGAGKRIPIARDCSVIRDKVPTDWGRQRRKIRARDGVVQRHTRDRPGGRHRAVAPHLPNVLSVLLRCPSLIRWYPLLFMADLHWASRMRFGRKPGAASDMLVRSFTNEFGKNNEERR